MTASHHFEPQNFVRTLTQGYAVMILTLMGFVPTLAIAYLYFFQDPALVFEHHSFHEVAIGISLLQSGFIAYVTYRCYLQTAELFLRWLTLGFLSFTVIYSLHGAFTRLAQDHMMLFILYGPASRLAMAACLLAGLLAYRHQEQTAAQAWPQRRWLAWLGAFAVIDVLVYLVAASPWAGLSRWLMEIPAMLIMLGCALTIVVRRIRSPLMTLYLLSLMFFAQSSLAFLLGPAWSHMWWLAHVIFAAGFMVLSYGVIQAYLTTGSFTRVYNQAELIEQVRAEKARTDDALLKLQRAHDALEISAATDALTGCANRREFESQATAAVARVKRSAAPLSFVMIDLDHFKSINDRYGHLAGDETLKAFAALMKKALRPSDLLGRLGGEEFALMLPDITLAGAATMAERIRQLAENEVIMVAGSEVRVTASLGVAQCGPDADTYESVLAAADARLYRAKREGRNRVVAA